MLFESQIHDLYNMLPWISTSNAKRNMRGIDAQKRRILTPEKVNDASEKVMARIEAMQHFRDAKVVMVYYPVNKEIDLRPLVRKYAQEKTFLFPALAHLTHRMEARVYEPHVPFIKGRFGIPQPQSPAYTGAIDLIITPGISFDKHHWRLGRGGGFYDRFLRHYMHVQKVGVCYDFQLHEKVPRWIFDRRVNRVITPTQSI